MTQRIERVASGYSGFFDAVKVREDKLDMVLQHDLNLVEMAEGVRAEMERASKVETGTEDWRKAIDGLMTRVEELDTLIDRRGEILRGLEI